MGKEPGSSGAQELGGIEAEADPRRCARRLFQELKMSGQITDEKLAIPFAIKVLQGGADQWMRNFYSDTRLVEAYNNDIWGYLDDE